MNNWHPPSCTCDGNQCAWTAGGSKHDDHDYQILVHVGSQVFAFPSWDQAEQFTDQLDEPYEITDGHTSIVP